ncbi:MAG: hypothetical protein BA863_04985 [Desulfovibrio sp. S3730MH75]|nr:MAG: hypothetical protein BA863_04985 [Desulfovibrio sp. S3730MH75]
MSTESVAISIRNLTKEYRLYNKPVHRVLETFFPSGKKYHHAFKALDDVSLEIFKGQTVGIVGRNGSGKSTLLQIICGIIKPTVGAIDVQGRISALLELGAGFNPEFTGRQNVYLNGSILGLTHEEIDERMDDILAFAGIGGFIDQPVKSYSSGMYVRLAFSVAISVEPEILIVDEALSVGDEAFQRKCFGKINAIQEQGGTILFVSHSTTSVIELCSRAFMLDNGELLVAGEPKQVVSRYQKMLYASDEGLEVMKNDLRNLPDRYHLTRGEDDDSSEEDEPVSIVQTSDDTQNLEGQRDFDPEMSPVSTVRYERKGAYIANPRIVTPEGRQVNILNAGGEYFYHYDVTFETAAQGIRFGMLIKTMKGIEISGSSAYHEGQDAGVRDGESFAVKFPFTCMLNPGVYFLNAGIIGIIDGQEEFLDRQLDVAMFRVEEKKDQFSTGLVGMVRAPQVEPV